MNNSTFSVEELYLMAEACDVNTIFGLPDKKLQVLLNPDFNSDAESKLKEKNVLNEQSRLTEGGFFVVQALEEYLFSEEYMRINNLMVAFSKNENNLIVLSEEKKEQEYKLLIYDKLSFLQELYLSIPFISRAPSLEDTEFTKKKIRNATRREWEKLLFEDNVFNVELFNSADIEDEQDHHLQLIFFEKENKLIGIDVSEGRYYQFSQYYFLKFIFDSLHISFEKEDIEKQHS